MTKLAKTDPITTLNRLRSYLDLPEHEARLTAGMQYGDQVKYVTWRFDTAKFETIELLHITDTQFGHVECRVHRIKEYIEWVLSEPNRFVVLGGDMIDASNVMSPGSPWENICESQGQVYKFCALFAPLRGRILGYVGGNHERRGIKTFGDIGLLIATLLRIPYSDGQQLIDIHFGAHKPWKGHLWHGGGSAATAGGVTQTIDKFMARHPGSDVYWIGHLHQCNLTTRVWSERLPAKQNVHMRKSFGLMSTSFLSYWGTYAEMKGLSATDILMWRTMLEPDGGWEVTLR